MILLTFNHVFTKYLIFVVLSKISSSSLSDGFDPTKINIEMGGFRPVYSKGTVEYVDHSLR